MPSWLTPKTDWASSDYYNYSALDRVENNTEYLKDYFITLGYIPSTTTFVTGRTKESLVYYDDMNRIENNIKALKDCSYTPLVWTNPVTNWISAYKVFGYTDANRLESNLVNLKTMMENIDAELEFCGSIYSGQDFNLGG